MLQDTGGFHVFPGSGPFMEQVLNKCLPHGQNEKQGQEEPTEVTDLWSAQLHWPLF